MCITLIVHGVAHRYGQLYLHCSLIYFWVPSGCFCIVISLSEGEIIRSAVSASRGGCIIHAGGVVASRTDWQTALMCNRRRPAATPSHHAEHHFQLWHQPNSFVYFASSAATSRWRICMSVIAAFASFSSLAFLSLGFVGNGVITVMINSPWQADDDANNQRQNNRGDSAHTSISLTVPPRFFEFCNQAVSLMLELTITSARQWSPDIAATVDCLTDILRSITVKAPLQPCCNATASWLFGESLSNGFLR